MTLIYYLIYKTPFLPDKDTCKIIYESAYMNKNPDTNYSD